MKVESLVSRTRDERMPCCSIHLVTFMLFLESDCTNKLLIEHKTGCSLSAYEIILSQI